MRLFKLARHDLTYYFDELIRMYSGGKESALEHEKVVNDFEYQIKRDKEINSIWICAVRYLTINELQCFSLYYFDRIPQERIACLMKISQEAVNHFLKKSIKKIRVNIKRDKQQLVFEWI